jgi:hypothetical protein
MGLHQQVQEGSQAKLSLRFQLLRLCPKERKRHHQQLGTNHRQQYQR